MVKIKYTEQSVLRNEICSRKNIYMFLFLQPITCWCFQFLTVGCCWQLYISTDTLLSTSEMSFKWVCYCPTVYPFRAPNWFPHNISEWTVGTGWDVCMYNRCFQDIRMFHAESLLFRPIILVSICKASYIFPLCNMCDCVITAHLYSVFIVHPVSVLCWVRADVLSPFLPTTRAYLFLCCAHHICMIWQWCWYFGVCWILSKFYALHILSVHDRTHGHHHQMLYNEALPVVRPNPKSIVSNPTNY